MYKNNNTLFVLLVIMKLNCYYYNLHEMGK